MRLPKVFDNTITASITGDALKNLDKPSPDSASMAAYWSKVNDIIEGQEAIQANAETYLPKFPYEQSEDYTFRVKYSKFTNVFRDITEGLAVKPFEREVTCTGNATLEDFCKDVDGSGNNLTIFSLDTFFNAINLAIDWIFVDYSNVGPVDPAKPRTVADEKALGVRPYWKHVRGSNVLEIQSQMFNGKETLTFMRILEPKDGDIYVRCLFSDGTAAHWELYKKNANATTTDASFILEDGGPISIGVIPLVPMITGRRKGTHWAFYPMMRDAADLQIKLYQKESGLENIENLAAFPMLAGQGVSPQVDAQNKPLPLRAGPAASIYAPMGANGQSGTWEWITPDATILSFLAADVKATIDQLRELGRQPLTAQSSNITVITAGVASGKAKSAVKMWALGLKDAINNAMTLTGMWFGLGDIDMNTEIFTDWQDAGDDETDALTALTAGRVRNDISRETWWDEMQRRNVLSTEFDPAKENERLLKELPGDDTEPDPTDPNDPTAKPPAAALAN